MIFNQKRFDRQQIRKIRKTKVLTLYWETILFNFRHLSDEIKKKYKIDQLERAPDEFMDK